MSNLEVFGVVLMLATLLIVICVLDKKRRQALQDVEDLRQSNHELFLSSDGYRREYVRKCTEYDNLMNGYNSRLSKEKEAELREYMRNQDHEIIELGLEVKNLEERLAIAEEIYRSDVPAYTDKLSNKINAIQFERKKLSNDGTF